MSGPGRVPLAGLFAPALVAWTVAGPAVAPLLEACPLSGAGPALAAGTSPPAAGPPGAEPQAEGESARAGGAFSGGASQREKAQGAGRAEDEVLERPAVLDLEPADLPRAEPGAWRGWTLGDPPPEAVVDELPAVRRALAADDVPAAIGALHSVLRRAPDYPPAIHQLGVLYFRLRRYSDAAECFERYLAAVPERLGDTRALAHCRYSLGDFEEAREHYERVIEAGDRSPQARFGLALCHAHLGEEARALELLREVARDDPRHVEARVWMARLLWERGDLDAALAAAEEARDLDPFTPEPWFLLARVRFERGEDDAADEARRRFELLAGIDAEVRTLEARLLVHPRDAAALARLVELHRQSGNIAAVRRAIERWFPLAPEDPGPRILALDVLVELGDEAGAALVARELARVAADDLAAWKRLVRYYARTRQRLLQLEAEQRARELGGER